MKILLSTFIYNYLLLLIFIIFLIVDYFGAYMRSNFFSTEEIWKIKM